MHGIFTLFRKELEDHFSSVPFFVISCAIVMVNPTITINAEIRRNRTLLK